MGRQETVLFAVSYLRHLDNNDGVGAEHCEHGDCDGSDGGDNERTLATVIGADWKGRWANFRWSGLTSILLRSIHDDSGHRGIRYGVHYGKNPGETDDKKETTDAADGLEPVRAGDTYLEWEIDLMTERKVSHVGER